MFIIKVFKNLVLNVIELYYIFKKYDKNKN